MNVDDALYHLVKDYEGGADALAPRAAMSVWSMRKKANPKYPGAHFSPRELVCIQQLSGDYRPLQAMADELGAIVIPMPACGVDPESEGGQGLAATVKEFADFMVVAAADFADNKIKDYELARIEAEAMQAQAAISRLCAIARRINAAAKPEKQP